MYESYALIKQALTAGGYRFVEDVLDAANYGVPQTRRRLFLVASRRRTPSRPLPTHTRTGDMFATKWRGWYGAVADLVETLPITAFADWQVETLQRKQPSTSSIFVVEGTAYSKSNRYTLPVRDADQPIFTVRPLKCVIRAQIGSHVVRLTPRCFFRLMGVPDTYRISADHRVAGRIAGNMVCPPVMAAIVEAQNENR